LSSPSLSISLEGFLRELGLAWQRLSLYQEGHPARQEVVLRAHTVLSALAAARGGLALGVGKDGFVSKDRKVRGGPAGRLAESLYRRHVAVVRFTEETSVEDLGTFLQAVPRSRPSEDETPLWDLLAAQGISRMRLEPVDLAYVATEDGEDGDEEGGREDSEPLWDSLLRSVLGQIERGGQSGGAGASGSSEGDRSLGGVLEAVERVLARRGTSLAELRGPATSGEIGAETGTGAGGSRSGSALERTAHGGEAGPSDVVVALGAVLGNTLASRVAGGAPAGHDVAELLGALPQALSDVVLERALTALAVSPGSPADTGGLPEPARATGFATLSDCLPTIQVIAALRRIRASSLSFSPSMVTLLDGLIAHAGRTDPSQVSPAELAGELAALFGDDDPDRRLPPDAELDRMAFELARLPPSAPPDPEAIALRVGSLTEHRQLTQLSLTLLDLLARPFLKRPAKEAVVRRLGEVFRSLLAEGTLGQAMQIPERLQELRGTEATAWAAELAFAELRKPESAAAFLERPEDLPPSAASTALRLAELLGYKVLDDLLEAMCEEEDLSRRRQIFDLMVSLGTPIVPRAQALLADERWYVQRNMISLLRRIGGGLSVETLGRSLEHDDPRVRLEALKGLGHGRATAEVIARAVNDPDPKVAQAAVAAVGSQHLEEGIAPLLALLAPRDPFGRHRALRLLALEALGQLGNPAALDGIAHFLRPWFSPVGAEERRAAYASLAGYPPKSRQPWLEKGRWSSDLVVRRLCREMLREAGGAP